MLQALCTRRTIESGCSRAWRHCSFPEIMDKEVGLWLQAGPGHIFLSQMSGDFHSFAKFLECKSPGVLKTVPG